MAEYIECRKCKAPSCTGCNTYILSQMLHRGKFNCLMDEHHTISSAADVAPKVNDAEGGRKGGLGHVVHGRWKGEGFGDFSCSICGVYQNIYTGLTNYCPNCGAKMDGEA